MQFVKLMSGTLDSTEKIEGTAANGLEVDVTRMSALVAGTANIGKLTDDQKIDINKVAGASVVVGSGTEATCMRVTLPTDGTGQVKLAASSAAIGKLAANDGVDIGDVTVNNASIAGTAGTPNAGVLTVQGVTSGTPLEVDGAVAHGAAISGNPIPIGAKAVSALPAEVDTGDVAYNLADMMGRQLVTHIPNTEQKSKAYNDTSSRAAGAAVAALTGTSGKKLAITGFTISTYGTTAARIFLYLALAADTTYTAGTDKPVFVGSFAPSATAYPGVVVMLPVPIFAETDTHVVMYQNSAAISIDIVFHYYEVE